MRSGELHVQKLRFAACQRGSALMQACEGGNDADPGTGGTGPYPLCKTCSAVWQSAAGGEPQPRHKLPRLCKRKALSKACNAEVRLPCSRHSALLILLSKRTLLQSQFCWAATTRLAVPFRPGCAPALCTVCAYQPSTKVSKLL